MCKVEWSWTILVRKLCAREKQSIRQRRRIFFDLLIQSHNSLHPRRTLVKNCNAGFLYSICIKYSRRRLYTVSVITSDVSNWVRRRTKASPSLSLACFRASFFLYTLIFIIDFSLLLTRLFKMFDSRHTFLNQRKISVKNF